MSNEEGLSRQQIFQQLFGKIEGLKDGMYNCACNSAKYFVFGFRKLVVYYSDDYVCALEDPVLLHGRLYLTKTSICFYSNLFGIEKKLKLPYEFIVRVEKAMTALVIPNAIAIVTGMFQFHTTIFHFSLPT